MFLMWSWQTNLEYIKLKLFERSARITHESFTIVYVDELIKTKRLRRPMLQLDAPVKEGLSPKKSQREESLYIKKIAENMTNQRVKIITSEDTEGGSLISWCWESASV